MRYLYPSFLCALLLLGQALPASAALGDRLRERLAERQHKQETAAAGPVSAPGDYRFSLQHGGLTRHYLLHVPRSLPAGQPAPLLMALHGGGGDMTLQADDAKYGLISLSERAGFIAVFPNGYSAFPGGKLATWNAGNCCGSARDKGIDDVGFLRAVVADVQARLPVDARRIYASGMSNGAMMAQRLACEAADLFSGIAAVAGTDNTQNCQPARQIPVLMIHARDDDHVLFNGGAGPKAFRDSSKVTEFRSVPATLAAWVRRNACLAPGQRVLEQPGATCDRYAVCRDDAAVQLCVTEEGGHSWPGGGTVRRGKGAPSQALSANEVMWAFFSREAAGAQAGTPAK